MPTRHNVENAKNLVRERIGAPYVYGGMFDPYDLRQGTDCSGVWNDVLATALGRLVWGREAEGNTTEAYRYIPIGGVGPFGTIRVGSPKDIPADATAKLAFHHEGTGGASSHMWGELDGMRIESAGSKGLVTGQAAWPIDHSYATAWAYLPGPISERRSAADILAAAAGITVSKARAILPTMQAGLRAANCTSQLRIAMFIAQLGHESDSFQATEEYANGDTSTDRWKYKGRTWIQITWKENYARFGSWCYDRELVPSRNYFVDNPTRLAEMKWAGIGAAWYWTVERPDINALSDAQNVTAVTYRINGGSNNLADRVNRYNRALAVGDELLALLQDDEEDSFMAALTEAQQKELLANTRWLRDQLGPNQWGPESSFGKNAHGEELTQRDGIAELKRGIEALADRIDEFIDHSRTDLTVDAK